MGHGLIVLFVSLAASLSTSVAVNAAPPPPSDKATAPKWIDLPDARLEMRGLPWLKENAPDLWRLPKRAQANVPKGVWNRAIAPDGGRIRLACNSTALAIRVQALHEHGKNCFFDAFVDGEYAASVSLEGTQRVDLVMFEHKDRAWKDVTIYLPHRHEVQVFAVGLDPAAELRAPPAFALKRPIVCYGSSVLQGTGALHPAHTYPAAAARRLNLDFVNLGFGGAGKGEVEVVALVNQLDACCYLFDLGKSYGAPTPERYTRMLDTIRASHPDAPIFCVTPIYSTKEPNEADYKKRSEDLRSIMRQAAIERRQAGDKLMFVVEGLELFGEPDKALFHDPQHPNDAGNDLIASRLAPVLEKVVLAESNRVRGKLDAGTNAVPIQMP
jgi:GDSL-like Lipase/Acylhydrolase family/N-terminus of Esterase_SGNH_hydro-type